jgi:hypothetical protein
MIAQNNKELLLQKKRKMLLFMPILVVPALALLFSILGGGKASAEDANGKSKLINDEFPSGIVKETDANKLKMSEESAKQEMLLNEDYKKSIDGNDFDYNNLSLSTKKDTLINTRLSNTGLSNERLNAMSNAYQQGIYEGNNGGTNEIGGYANTNNGGGYGNQNKVRSAQQQNSAPPPNPPVAQNNTPKSKFNITYGSGGGSSNSSSPSSSTQSKRVSFFKAVIHGDQQVKSGTTVKMHLLEEVRLDNLVLPVNTVIHGFGSSSGMERITLKVTSIRSNGEIVSVNWLVYDTDGNEGIRVPGYGKDKQDVRNQTIDDGANEVSNAAGTELSEDRAAAAGARIGTNLFRNKASKKRLPKVDLASGYQILIGIQK